MFFQPKKETLNVSLNHAGLPTETLSNQMVLNILGYSTQIICTITCTTTYDGPHIGGNQLGYTQIFKDSVSLA